MSNKALFVFAILILLSFSLGAISIDDNQSHDLAGIEAIEVEIKPSPNSFIGIGRLRMESLFLSHGGSTLDATLWGEASTFMGAGAPELTMKRSGKTLKIQIAAANNFYFFLTRKGDLSFQLLIPEDYRGKLSVKSYSSPITFQGLILGELESHSSSGQTVVQNLQAKTIRLSTSSGGILLEEAQTGHLICEASSGGITLKNINAKNATLECSSGGIEADGFFTGSADIDVSSGGIKLHRAEGSLNLESSSGGIQVEWLHYGAPSTIECSSGTIRLSLPESSAFDLIAETSSGSISLDFPIVVEGGREFDSDEVEGEVNGGGPLLMVDSSSGSISINSY